VNKREKLAEKIKKERSETLDRMWDRVYEEALKANICAQKLAQCMQLLNDRDIKDLKLEKYIEDFKENIE